MLRLQRFNLDVKYKPGAQMYLADHLSRATLADNKEMTDNFQVFALEMETLTPFDSIKVALERLRAQHTISPWRPLRPLF